MFGGSGKSKGITVCVFLKDIQRYPGDVLTGLVKVELTERTELVSLEVSLRGKEFSTIGGMRSAKSNMETRKTTYYRQYLTLLGQPHYALRYPSVAAPPLLTPPPLPPLSAERDSPVPNSDGHGVLLLHNTTLSAGTCTFPFSVRLPDVLPPSTLIDKGFGGSLTLEYTAMAQLLTHSGTEASDVVPFNVQQLPLPLSRWLLLHRPEDAVDEVGDDISVASAATRAGSTAGDESNRRPGVRRRLDHGVTFSPEEIQREAARLREDGCGDSAGPTPLSSQGDSLRRRSLRPGVLPSPRSLAQEQENRRGSAAFQASSTSAPCSPDERNGSNGGGGGAAVAKPADAVTAEVPGAMMSEVAAASATSSDVFSRRGTTAAVVTPWVQDFVLPLRSGMMRLSRSRVGVQLTLNNAVLLRGHHPLTLEAVVDNSNGTASIARVKFSLIARSTIRSRFEVLNFSKVLDEVIIEEKIAKGRRVRIEKLRLNVPGTAPLTQFTRGYSSQVFLSMRVYSASAIKATSVSLESELMVVNAVDLQCESRRLLTWTNVFRERGLGDAEATAAPVDLTAANAQLKVLNAADIDDMTAAASIKEVVVGGSGSGGGSLVARGKANGGGGAAASRGKPHHRTAAGEKALMSAMGRLRLRAPLLNFETPTFFPMETKSPTAHLDPNAANPFTVTNVANVYADDTSDEDDIASSVEAAV